jgi:hypothetical protein
MFIEHKYKHINICIYMYTYVQKLVQCSTIDAENNAKTETEIDINRSKNGDISSSIINHIRFCEMIFQPRLLLNLIMESISIVSYGIQVEIISALPGIYIYTCICIYKYMNIDIYI